jgi:hypothetical protein
MTEREEDAAVQQVKDALRSLPPDVQDEVFEKLARAALEAQRLGTREALDTFMRFIKNLTVTAQMHANPRFRKNLAEADEELERGDLRPLSFEEFVAEAEAHVRGR